MKKSKLLHVLYAGDFAGAEVCVKMLVADMDKNKFKNSVCFLYELGNIGKQIQSLGIPAYSFGMKHGLHFAGAMRFLSFLLKNKFELIHFHQPNVLTILLGRLLCNKVIYHVHDSGSNRGLRKFFLTMVCRSFDKILAVSQDSKRNFQRTYGIPDNHITLVYNSIDTKKFNISFDHTAFKKSAGIDTKKIIIGFVGRLVKHKGCELLMDAITIAQKSQDNFQVLMFGQGPLQQNLETLIKDKNLNNVVRLMGLHENIEYFFNIFDLLVVSSREESFGIVVIEAMAAGTPVAAFAVGGIPEIIRDGVDGFLVEPNNTEKLAEKIGLLISDSDLRKNMGQEALKRAQDFTIEKYVESMEKIYQSVINR